MPSNAKSNLTPKLRFPEFRKEPGWKETLLSSVLTEHEEKNDGASEVHSVSVHKGVVNQVEHLGRSFAAADRSNYNLAKPHDIIYTKSPTGDFPWGVVKQNKLPYNVIVSPLYGVFSPVNRYLGYIFDAYFESPIRTTNYLAPITQKGAKNTIQISNTTFLSKGLYLPSDEAEQQKIAECLSTLDELMAAESQKLDALKAHKKGLMQQLFPRAGETRPRLRFPDFQNAPEWKETRLEDLCERIMDGTHFSPKTKTGPRLYLTSKNIQDGRMALANVCYISEDEHRQIYARCPVKLHDVLLTKDGANTGNCAMNVLDYEFSLLSSVAVLRGKKNCLDQRFLFHSILSDRTQTLIQESMSGQAITRITLEKLGNYLLPTTSLEEQRRIADCLSSLDDLIAGQSVKLAALKTHKQGLMQQLFPNQEEIKS